MINVKVLTIKIKYIGIRKIQTDLNNPNCLLNNKYVSSFIQLSSSQ